MLYIYFLIVIQCTCLTWGMNCTSDQIPALQEICECVNDGIMCNTSTIILSGPDVDILYYLVGNYSLIEKIDVSDYGPGLNISSTLFTKFSQLRHLRVHHCNIVNVAPRAFSNLPELRTLEVTGNPFLLYDSITAGLEFLNSPYLYLLNISGNHNAENLLLAHIKYVMFEYITNTSLTVLDISWSRLSLILAPFYLLPHLEVLNMSGTYLIGHMHCISSFITLENITMAVLDHWPKLARGHDSVIPSDELNGLYKRNSEKICQPEKLVSKRGCFRSMPEKFSSMILRYVDLDSLFLNVSNDMCLEHNNVMNYVLTRSKFSKQLGIYFGYHQLKLFDMSFPDISFPGPVIKPNMFHDMPSLMTIRIPGFHLNRLSTEHVKNLFVKNLFLTILDISFNELTSIRSEILVENKFIEVLNVSNNNLKEFNVDLSNCDGIRSIDLTNNLLKKIDVGVTSHLSSVNSSIKVYLHGNVLNCECHLLNFFQSENIEFDNTDCLFNNEWKTLDDMTTEFMEEVCSHEPDITPIIAGTMSGAVVIIIIVGIIVWRLRKGNSDGQPDQQTPISVVFPISNLEMKTRKPKFVVFLAYSSRDSDFVIDKIYWNLNEKLKSRLSNIDPEQLIIIYDKHFLAGIDIDEICRMAILESHVTVAVVTENFLDSAWCNLEVKMAITSKVPLIPLFVSKCNSDKLTGFLRVVYDEKVRLMWPDTTNLDSVKALKAENDTLDILCSHIIAYVEQNSEHIDEK